MLIAEHAQEQPDETCLLWLDEKGSEDERLTFSELYQCGCTVAYKLIHEIGLRRGDRVLLVFSPCLDFCATFLGCLIAGVIALPVYPPDPRNPTRGMNKLNMVVNSAHIKVALMDPQFRLAKRLQQLSRKGPKYPADLDFVTIDLGTIRKQTVAMSPLTMEELQRRDFSSEIAFVQYTSGSTGSPKGVRIPFSALSHNIHNMIWTKGLEKTQTGCSWAPFYHDMGLVGSFLLLASAGCKHVAFSPVSFIKDPLLWIEVVARYKAHITNAPNFAFELVTRRQESNPNRLLHQYKEGKLDLSSCKRWSNCSEPVKKTTLDNFVNGFRFAGVEPEYICPCYGMAENVVFATGHYGPPTRVVTVKVKSDSLIEGSKVDLVKEEESEDISTLDVVGNGTANFLVRVAVSVKGRVVHDEGLVGELVLSGPCVADGYDGESQEATEKAFYSTVSGEKSYFTGDMGFIWKNQVFVCGRIKDMLIVNGVNFYPQDLEQTAFDSNPDIQRGGCQVAYQDAEGKVVILTELKSTKQSPEDLRDLALEIRNKIALVNGLQVHRICLTGPKTLLKTTSGKIQRRQTQLIHKEERLKIVFELAAPGSEDDRAPPPPLISYDAVQWLCGRIANILQVPSDMILPNTELESVGQTSMQSVALMRALEDVSNVTDLPRSILGDSRTPADLIASLRSSISEKTCRELVFPDLNLGTTEETRSVLFSSPIITILQTLGILHLFSCVSFCSLPSYYFSLWVLDQPNQNFMSLLLPMVVPIWMVSFTALVVVMKWLMIGRYMEHAIALNSAAFLRWWMIDRLVCLWEECVGWLLLGSSWLTLVYSILGAKVGQGTEINTFFREFDLVTIGCGVCIDGNLLARTFTQKQQLRFRRISVGDEAAIADLAVVLPGCVVGKRVVLMPLGVLREGSITKDNMSYESSPAREHQFIDYASGEKRSRCSILFYDICRLLGLFCLLYLSTGISFPVFFLWQLIPDSTGISSLLSWVLTPFVSTLLLGLPCNIALKWLLVGKVRPGQDPQSTGHRFGKWFVDKLFALNMRFASVAIEDGNGNSVSLLRLFGASFGKDAYFGSLRNISVSTVDLLTIGERSFVSWVTFQPSHLGSYKETIVHEEAQVGLFAVLGAGSTVGKQALAVPLQYHSKPSEECPQESRPLPSERHFGRGPQSMVLNFLARLIFLLFHLGLLLPALLVGKWVFGVLDVRLAFVLVGPIALPIALVCQETGSGVLLRLLLGKSKDIKKFPCSDRAYVFSQTVSETKFLLLSVLGGTHWMNIYYRCKGAKCSSSALVLEPGLKEPFLHTYEDNCILDEKCFVAGHKFLDGEISAGRVVVQENAILNVRSTVFCGMTSGGGVMLPNTVAEGQLLLSV